MSADPDPKTYYKRALNLTCPECGEHPLFVALKETRTLDQWMHPLPGCPKCGFKYEREAGYFLLATWVLNYGIVGGIGLALALIAEWCWHPPLWKTLLAVCVPVIISNFLFVRHSKALFMAFDHIMDPHYKQLERAEKEQQGPPPTHS